jgi:hypothetical protein
MTTMSLLIYILPMFYRLLTRQKTPSCAEDWSGETSWIDIHVGSVNWILVLFCVWWIKMHVFSLFTLCFHALFVSTTVLLHGACLSLTFTTNSIRQFSLNYILHIHDWWIKGTTIRTVWVDKFYLGVCIYFSRIGRIF